MFLDVADRGAGRSPARDGVPKNLVASSGDFVYRFKCDPVAQALEAAEVRGDLAAVLGAGFIPIGTEVAVVGRRAREQGVGDGEQGVAGGQLGLALPWRLDRRR